LQDFALARQQVDIRAILIAHPEGPALVEGQSLRVGRQVRVVDGGDREVDFFYCLDC